MAIWQNFSRRRGSQQRKRRSASVPKSLKQMAKRSLRLEPFEERILLAIDGPQLLAAIPATGQVINDNTTLTVAPREILLRFNQPIDPASLMGPNGLANIRVVGDGADNLFNTNDDLIVKPGYIGIEGAPNEVLVRFAENLPDDVYFLTVISGPTGLKSTAGKQFMDGATMNRPFRLDLPPQVVAIVPQPISRDSVTGKLQQSVNTIEVFFNVNDKLDVSSAQNVDNYQLIRTGAGNGTATPADDDVIKPQSVSYSDTTGKAILTFAPTVLTTAGTYRLRVGNSEAPAKPVTTITPGSSGNSFSTAAVIGNPFTTTAGVTPGTQTVTLTDNLVNVPVSGITWPGDPNGPGERENNSDTQHVSGSPNNSSTPVIIPYNFDVIGEKFGQTFANLITEPQKDRVREVFEYFSYYLGVQFVETATEGYTIALGNPAFLGGTPNVGGIAGGGTAIMNFSVDWGASEPRGAFFNTAMHEIGHLLGLKHNYESPAVMGGGIQDGVYPGDLDVIYGRYLYPALGNDINVYRFNLASAGRLNVETIAERLKSLNLAAQPSMLDSVITVFDASGNIVARNDDYYGKDSFLQLDLAAGTYYIAVTSTGNTNFDPRVANSGADGTTAGGYQLRMSFTPTTSAANSIRDLSGIALDGDNDGQAGGANNFWFKTGNTIYVDKAATAGTGPLGSITNPYTRIGDALAAAPQGAIVRIVGNGGADKNLATTGDNLSYNIGFDSINTPLADGTQFNVPKGVTVMIDAGTIIKLRGANINVGSVDPESINRAEGALQILGTTERNDAGDVGSVYITSYYNSNTPQSVGAPVPNVGTLAKGNWGGIVFRNDSDLEANGVFLNYVNQARISWGGGVVSVDGQNGVYRSIHMESARPTLTFNTITSSADAAMSATPNSFEESQYQGPGYQADYTRVGPKIYGNTLTQNSINGLFVSIQTSSQTGRVLDELTVNGRFANTDIVHVLTETLLINGQPGGPGSSLTTSANFDSRPSARLAIDPGTIVKSTGGRFEVEMGGQLIAEGTVNRPIIFTSLYDDRYGASGTSDTSNNNRDILPTPGDWGGFMFAPTSIGSIDRALVAFAGGEVRFEGAPDNMNPVEINQAQVRIANSTFDFNRLPGGGARNGRGGAAPAVVYVSGAQPVILNNIFQNNTGGSVININVNSLNSRLIDDWGRSRGPIGFAGSYATNYGPLVRGNLIGNNTVNGMVVRGGVLTTNSTWDDVDIVHVVTSTITLDNQQSLTGTLRLQSSPTESLVVKLLGTNVDIVAGGSLLDIDDRVGGTLQIVGTPGHAVVLTSLKDDTVGAGLTPQGTPQTDTLNRKGVVPDPPPNLATSGPVILDTTARDVHGTNAPGLDGWDALYKNVLYAYTNSRVANKPARILVVGWETDPFPTQLGTPYSAEAIRWAVTQPGLTGVQLTFADTGSEIATGLANAEQYALIYVPSHSAYPLPTGRATQYNGTKWWGGVDDFHLETLNENKGLLIDYINNKGGGLVVMAQDSAPSPYNFVSAADPFVLRKSGGNVMTATETIAAGFNAINYTDTWLNVGTPYRSVFEGSTGFNRLTPWAVDPVTGEVAMLGHAAGGPGLGAPHDVVTPGDWGSIRLDSLSNDRNVEVVNEVEQGFTSAGDANQMPTTAQSLGEIAKDLMAGNDNVRLGFEIHGNLSQAADSPGGADVDVYSFRGTAGTVVWLDIDRTSSSLDTVVELVDANGAVIARSDNSIAESANPALLVGSAKRMQKGSVNSSVFSTPDFYTSNAKDAGMRVTLPGSGNSIGNYFVRVRSSSTNLNNLTGGVTKGSYVLQVRLQETDEFPGSAIRYADVRYANNGIEVIGKPESSILVSNTAQSGLGNGTFDTAQDLGNLLQTPSKTIDVAATLNSATAVHWYKFSLNYEQIQSIQGLNDGLRTFAAMLQVNYADGLGRPDTTLSLYDATGRLLLISRDGQIADSLPRPNIGGIGSDQTNLAHGSFGPLDPTLGPIQLAAGTPAATADDRITYYVAISSNGMLPEALTASFAENSSNPLIRLEPVDSINRVIDDRVGFSAGGITTAGAPAGTLFSPGNLPLEAGLNRYADSLHFGDIVMFVNSSGNSRQLKTVNPFTGAEMTTGGLTLAGGLEYDNIAIRNDGRMYAYTRGNSNANSGLYSEINTATGAVISSNDDDLIPFRDSNIQDPITFAQVNVGVQFTAWAYHQEGTTRRLFAIGYRTDSPSSGSSGTQISTQNLLFELNPDTGEVMHLASQVQPGLQAWNPVTGSSGTNAVPIGVISQASGQIIGMTFVEDRLFGVTADGELYELVDGLLPTTSNPDVYDAARGEFIGQVNVGGQALTSMTTGPQNVEGGKYKDTLFAISGSGRVFAFDLAAAARSVFLNGASSIDTGITNAEGLVFSPFDYNLWHATTSRGTDLGHGINPSYNNNAARTPAVTPPQQLAGAGSYYFGVESGPFGSNPGIVNTYAVPGGAYGTLTSQTFDLVGYSAMDKPTLYFNYFLDTDNNDTNLGATDAFRVLASTDGVNWQMLATNNVASAETPTVITPSGGVYKGQNASQRVQGLWDNTPLPGAPAGEYAWRQARVDLGDWAGKAGIRLRFEFSTAGTMGSGQALLGTGAALKALPGSQINNNQTFQIGGQTFTFRKGSAATLPTHVPIGEGYTSAQVAEEIAKALDRVFTVGTDDLSIFTSSKVVGDEIRLFGLTIDDDGPMASFSGQLPGDTTGNFKSRARDRSNTAFEGVYIDDFIVGFASRGEMVTGALEDDTEFAPVPSVPGDPQQLLTGAYQLQIRQARAYGEVGQIPGTHTLTASFDVNDRFAQAFTIVAPSANAVTDGAWFAIDDGSQELQFEFDFNNSLTSPNRVRVAVTPGMSAASVAIAIRNAINGAVTSRGFKVRAATRDIAAGSGLTENGNRVDLFDAFGVLDRGVVGKLEFNSIGDVRPANKVPGQTIVQDSIVTHSRQVGILVAPKMGQISETGVAFTDLGTFPVGTPGNVGSIANIATNNPRGWVPGVTIKNNLVTHSGRTGIAILGDPNASYAYAQKGSEFASLFRDIELFLPFVRVLNNTVYNAKIGIAAANTSSPTIINNIIANARIVTDNVVRFAGGAIYVDGSSGNDKALPLGVQSLFGRTVVLANIYQNNTNTVLGTSDSLSIALEAGDPLFVDAANDNFYLNPNSKAIDSSVDSLLDRDALANPLETIGIARSPILAPTFDVYGQLRVDDPAVSPPAGVGGNAFKDRGAIERADFVGPTASLLNPVDNNPDDRNSSPNQVTLLNTVLTNFGIRLNDGGVGIDDSTVDITKFVIRRTIGTEQVTLQAGIDYTMVYDTNSSIVRLLPSQGIWVNGLYEIEVASGAASGIKDIAGNVLQQNAPPVTRFVVNLTDTIVSPWQNPTNRFDVNNDTRVNGQDLLWLINKILTDGPGTLPVVATAPPYFDVTGDGRLNTSDMLAVINHILDPVANPAVASPLAAVAGESDASAAERAQVAPQASPLVGVDAVAAGLTIGDSSTDAPQAASASPQAAPHAAAAPASARAVDLAIYSAESISLVDDADEAEAWDDEMDSILDELGGKV